MGPASRAMKRLLDVAASGAGLVALSPVLVGIAGVVLKYHGWPPVFAQRRPGLHGRLFTLYKFRTMTNERGADGKLLPDQDRLTRVGQWLRTLSLDELPELVNVLLGEMSLVGPRPLLVEYLERYSLEQMRRHDVKPGITGWAQIHGRNALTWEEKFALDVWYVDHWSLLLDLEILAKTALKVVAREGISQSGHVTMPNFTGAHVNGDARGA